LSEAISLADAIVDGELVESAYVSRQGQRSIEVVTLKVHGWSKGSVPETLKVAIPVVATTSCDGPDPFFIAAGARAVYYLREAPEFGMRQPLRIDYRFHRSQADVLDAPRPGIEQDVWRRIELAPPVDGDCVELPAGRYALRLPLADLRRMALDAGPIVGPEEGRVLRLFEGRAQDLLSRLGNWSAAGACVTVAQGWTEEDRHLAAELLKARRGEVRRADGSVAGVVWMRHYGRRSGPSGRGEILFYADPGGDPFLTVDWWRA
jgi:hypothetical protein